MSQIKQAVAFLEAHPMLALTPDGIREQAGIAGSTEALGRKCRIAAREGVLEKETYINRNGVKTTAYRWNVHSKGNVHAAWTKGEK